jgi:hypothetical protein
VHGDAHGHTHPGRGDLLDDLEVDLIGLSAAAVLLGIRQGEQPRAAQQGEGVARELGGLLGGTHNGRELVGTDLPGQIDEVLGFLGGHEALC